MKSPIKALVAVALAMQMGIAVADTADDSLRYYPGREDAIPGVENDYTDTYRHWKDRDAIRQSMADGLSDEEMNYKNIRWLKKDNLNAEFLFDEAKDLFSHVGSKDKSCASCHGAEAKDLKGVATKYPKFDKELDRVVALSTKIREHGAEHVGLDLPESGGDNTLLAAYINSLSDGIPIQVEVSSGPGKESFERGRDLYFKRNGHYDFSCASCHTPPTVLKQLRGMRPSSPYGDAASYPIFEFPNHPERHYLYTIQQQIIACADQARMITLEEGSPEYTDMEVFLRALANGYEINALSSYYGEALD